MKWEQFKIVLLFMDHPVYLFYIPCIYIAIIVDVYIYMLLLLIFYCNDTYLYCFSHFKCLCFLRPNNLTLEDYEFGMPTSEIS